MSQKLDLNYPYGKFWRGIVRWSRDGKIDLKSEKGISQVNALLKVICHSPAFDCYDGNFNGLSLDAVVNSLNIDLDAEEYHSDCPHNYRIEHITSFDRTGAYSNPNLPTTNMPAMERTASISASGTIWRRFRRSRGKNIRMTNTDIP